MFQMDERMKIKKTVKLAECCANCQHLAKDKCTLEILKIIKDKKIKVCSAYEIKDEDFKNKVDILIRNGYLEKSDIKLLSNNIERLKRLYPEIIKLSYVKALTYDALDVDDEFLDGIYEDEHSDNFLEDEFIGVEYFFNKEMEE